MTRVRPIAQDDDSSWVPPRRSRLSETVADQIREAILAGRLQPGQRIVETELAERLRVSKSPVREALKELEREGLIQITPHQGASVRPITTKDVREIASLRAVLEGLAVSLAMERATDEWLRSLDRQVQRMRRAKGQTEVNDLHLEFHEMLVGQADHSRLDEMLGSLWAQIRTFLAFVDLLYPSSDAIADDHAALMDVIRAGDVGRARQAVEEHVTLTGRDLEQIWIRERGREDHGQEGVRQAGKQA